MTINMVAAIALVHLGGILVLNPMSVKTGKGFHVEPGN